MKHSYLVLAQIVGLLLFVGCKQTSTSKEDGVAKQDTFCLNDMLKKKTGIVAVEERPIMEQLTLSGKIEYNENDLVAFRSLLEGSVEQVQFELGDYVRKGQVLATIRSAEIQGLYQEKRNQENQIQLLKNQIQTKKEMLQDGLFSAPELLQMEHELEHARIELDRIVQSLALYRAVGSNSFQVLAPKDGYIIQKSISAGQNIVSDSDPLFSISNLKEVWVMVNIYATNLRYVQVGDQVKVRTIAYPDQVYPGKIDKIYNVFDDNEHVLKARVVLSNPTLRLMPGLSADIIIDKNNSQGTALAIPNNAVVFHSNHEHIVVYKDDCHLRTLPITKVGSNEEYTFIAEKLQPGEQVVGSNALLIYEELNK
ncbi:efflux RND transporter periplasmic adaptor subunit [Sphingobacterium tabacisoli]|uniref:Efflux RND transporter periplasmic adaptor subunit n=1 Tax=Sphingobacterium tabacisoli TaxID=2044855 RepID=A0ABW5L773_9SPHI|nr:efflux RND transporter periplasmic adaptor subunit [Sphingobacterium tabacisoli]